MLSKLTRSVQRPSFSIVKRGFRTSNGLRWRHVDDLSPEDIRQEFTARQPGATLPRTHADLITALRAVVDARGGHDNGLTTSRELVLEKRMEEARANQIPGGQEYSTLLFAKSRHQRRIKALFADEPAIQFGKGGESMIQIDGSYDQVRVLRDQVLSAISETTANETIYSFSGKIITEVMEHVKKIPQDLDVHCSVLRIASEGQEVYVLGISGQEDERYKACSSFENLFNDLKRAERDDPADGGQDKLSAGSKFEGRSGKRKRHLKAEVSVAETKLTMSEWWKRFVDFEGQLLYLDSQHRHLLSTATEQLVEVEETWGVNIFYEGGHNGTLGWLRQGEIGIAGPEATVSQAVRKVDQIISSLKKTNAVLVFPKGIESEIRKNQDALSSFETHLGAVEIRFQDAWVEAHVRAANDEALAHILGRLDFFVQKSLSTSDQASGDLETRQRRSRLKGLDFADAFGIGGLDAMLKTMIRRTFESRMIPNRLRRELGLQHIKGVLLYGPPGTGKTLTARKISEILGCKEPVVVNGPEVESKWVGEAEKNIRALFEEAEKDFHENGENANLHVIIFDEIDAIAKQRGGPHAKSRDGALNQLLCCMDGINTIDNVIVFALTNRKDTLDPALLRPGRLEVQLEIPAPDEEGRLEILNIHTKSMQNAKRLGATVDLQALAGMTDRFSGADIAGLVRNAISFALDEVEDDDLETVTVEGVHFDRAIYECRKTKEAIEISDDDYENYDGLMQA